LQGSRVHGLTPPAQWASPARQPVASPTS
jgi:hypothetical protein